MGRRRKSHLNRTNDDNLSKWVKDADEVDALIATADLALQMARRLVGAQVLSKLLEDRDRLESLTAQTTREETVQEKTKDDNEETTKRESNVDRPSRRDCVGGTRGARRGREYKKVESSK